MGEEAAWLLYNHVAANHLPTPPHPLLQFSEGSPLCAVCGRGDLDPKAPVARGCECFFCCLIFLPSVPQCPCGARL